MIKPNPSWEGDGKPRVSSRQPGCLGDLKSRVTLRKKVAWLLRLYWIAVLTKKQTTIVELKMERIDLLIFAIIVGIVYVIFKILDKKMRP